MSKPRAHVTERFCITYAQASLAGCGKIGSARVLISIFHLS
jgi:hypothetical protein